MQVLYGRMYFEDATCQNDLIPYTTDNNESALATADGRVEFLKRNGEVMALVKSPPDYPIYYPVRSTPFSGSARGILMDLDGTTILSEEFWVGAIEETVGLLLNDPGFKFTPDDLPHVVGYSTREHLQYCIGKYKIETTIKKALKMNSVVSEARLSQLEQNEGSSLLKASPGLKEFLIALKDHGIKIGLVTAASERKALIEIRSVFRELDLGDPLDFYDTIITAGNSGGKFKVSTLGSLASKPHPWLYAEAARVGLGLGEEEREHIIGIEDSAAGVISLKLAGFAAIGMKEGNITSSGVRPLLHAECEYLPDLLPLLIK